MSFIFHKRDKARENHIRASIGSSIWFEQENRPEFNSGIQLKYHSSKNEIANHIGTKLEKSIEFTIQPFNNKFYFRYDRIVPLGDGEARRGTDSLRC